MLNLESGTMHHLRPLEPYPAVAAAQYDRLGLLDSVFFSQPARLQYVPYHRYQPVEDTCQLPRVVLDAVDTDILIGALEFLIPMYCLNFPSEPIGAVAHHGQLVEGENHGRIRTVHERVLVFLLALDGITAQYFLQESSLVNRFSAAICRYVR